MSWSPARVQPPDWKRRKAAVQRRDNHICHVCGHPGADQVDHLVNAAAGGGHEPANLAPIHGQPCPTCGRRCHNEKSQREAAAARAARAALGRHPREQHPGLS